MTRDNNSCFGLRTVSKSVPDPDPSEKAFFPELRSDPDFEPVLYARTGNAGINAAGAAAPVV